MMTKIFRLSLLFLEFVFTANAAYSAGYTCDTRRRYTSCGAGYYMTAGPSSTVCDISQNIGNDCHPCSDMGPDYTCAGGTACPTLTCAPGTYLNGSTCAPCGGSAYYCPGGTWTINNGVQGRYDVAAGYYSTGGDDADHRTGQEQCTGTTYCTDGVQYECPDAETHKRTTFPDNYYDATNWRSSVVERIVGRTNISQCVVTNWLTGTRGTLYEHAGYNPDTSKYDITHDYGWSDVPAGYYLTTKGVCGSYAYYLDNKPCPAGSYCPGRVAVECNASNQATVHTETFGLETCPAGSYCPANSAAPTACPAGAYCPANSAAPTACPDGTIAPAGATSADACQIDSKFNVTTTNMAANTSFSFKMSASGTFYVDWGDGSEVQTIERTDTIEATYRHTYTTAGVYTIKFGGRATGYSTSDTAAISFSNNKYIAGISGSLGAIFPTLGINNGQIPCFYGTFSGCSNLSGSIPADLFRGVAGSADSMFAFTFNGCSGLSGEIPAGLFSGVSGSASGMFGATFKGCSKLSGSIPADLFSGVTGSAESMFRETFKGCSGLSGSIPADLFHGVTGSADWMFSSTFYGCSGLTGKIPDGLFSGVTGSAYSMFNSTFEGCSNLTGEIPAGLFSGVTGSAESMFNRTFKGCSGLSGSIPTDLFRGVTGSAVHMFVSTFYGCSGLTGPIPADLFSEVSGSAEAMFNATFAMCSGLSGEIPEGLFRGVTGSADHMFNSTFYGCSGLSGEIPGELFRGVTGSADHMFYSTFYKCSKLSGEIPGDLFRGVTGSARSMFDGTFWGCSKLSGSIPATLFSGVTGSADYMFAFTFNGCSGLSGEIPAGLFSGVSGSASGMFGATFKGCSGLSGYVPGDMFPDNTTGATDMYTDTFTNTPKMDTSCPANMYDTPPVGAESWTVAVCRPCPDNAIAPAGATSADACQACPANYIPHSNQNMCQITCQPGTYLATANADACTNVGAGFWAAQSVVNYGDVSARNACPDNLTTIGFGPGADSADDCGKVLHIGNHQLYLRSVKSTSPSLVVQSGNHILYGDTTTEKRGHLCVQYNGTVYSVFNPDID